MKKKIILISTLLVIGLGFCFTCFLMFGYTTKLQFQIKNIEDIARTGGIVIASTEKDNGHGQITIPLDSLTKLGQVNNSENQKEIERAILIKSVSDIESVLLTLFLIGLALILLSGVLIRNVLKNDKLAPTT